MSGPLCLQILRCCWRREHWRREENPGRQQGGPCVSQSPWRYDHLFVRHQDVFELFECEFQLNDHFVHFCNIIIMCHPLRTRVWWVGDAAHRPPSRRTWLAGTDSAETLSNRWPSERRSSTRSSRRLCATLTWSLCCWHPAGPLPQAPPTRWSTPPSRPAAGKQEAFLYFILNRK